MGYEQFLQQKEYTSSSPKFIGLGRQFLECKDVAVRKIPKRVLE
jgi:hypothetical protein